MSTNNPAGGDLRSDRRHSAAAAEKKRVLDGSMPPAAVVKYKKYSSAIEPVTSQKTSPTQHWSESSKPTFNPFGSRPRPKIVELLDIGDFTSKVTSAVPVDEPIFQPFPPEVTFHNYQPFKTYEATLFLRNNDTVARRLKVLPPDTPYFSVRRHTHPGKNDSSKVAAGMELAYVITFTPQTQDDYSYDIVVATEREKFIVPVIASGACAVLDLPDALELPATPARMHCSRTLLVRNVGAKAASFSLAAQMPFSVSPEQGQLAPGETVQVAVGFTPPQAGVYMGELELQYDTGRCTSTQLSGQSYDLEVGLDTDLVTLLPTYVNKSSQKSFRIVNTSDVAINYAIKMHPDEETEISATQGRMREADNIEAATEGDYANRTIDLDDEDSIVADAGAAMARSLKRLRREIKLDNYSFEHANFSAAPLSGTIHPRSEAEVVVQFLPDHSREYEAVAFVQLQGCSARLPVVFRGQGLGPQAVFSYDVLDVGDTYINTLHQYEVELQNRGKIPAEFHLLPPETPFASKFKFEPDTGTLAPGQATAIKVKLLSNLLGAFDETFHWAIKGSSTPQNLQFRGRVVGPSFTVEPAELDFGIVSYGFRYTKELLLCNTSEIPMRFAWRVPADKQEPDGREFAILPSRGSILPHGRQKVTVEFVSQTMQRYDMTLLLDIPSVSEAVHSIPISGECVVPKLSLLSNVLSFGECFLRHPYKQALRIINESKLPAKYEVLPQDNQSRSLATFTAEPASGGIPARGEQLVEFTLSTARLGRIQLPVRVKVLGSRGKPLECVIDARSIGPLLEFGSEHGKRHKTAAINFDKCAVLTEHSRELHLYNPSLITAEYKTFVEGSHSVFSVDNQEGVLRPGEGTTIRVSVSMDDTQRFTDVMHVLVHEGADMAVPLEATGTGNVVVSTGLADVMEFGSQFVGRAFHRQVVVSNLGRHVLNMAWTNVRGEDLKKDFAKLNRGSGKKLDQTQMPQEFQPVFSVTPARLTLQPKESVTLIISGICHQTGSMAEQLICNATQGSQNKGSKVCFDVSMRAEITVPLLSFSEPSLTFEYTWVPGTTPETIQRNVTLRNISALPLAFSLRCQAPFSVDATAYELAVDEAVTVSITMDPNWKGDLQSAVFKQRLAVVYTDNPQKDGIDLKGDVSFPNLSLESTNLDFGSVLLDTVRRVGLTAANPSRVPVAFTWGFAKEQVEDLVPGGTSLSSSGFIGGKGRVMPSQLFDILPIRGVIPPLASERFEFSYFAFPGVKATGMALCSVEGGPQYTVALNGESNQIKYMVEPQAFDLGIQLYERTVERELNIANNGKVPFDFNLNMIALSRPGIVTAVPPSGRLGPGQKEIVRLRVKAGIPERLMERVLVEIAHFEPVELQVVIEGVFPTVGINLPRVKDDLFAACLEGARERLGLNAHGRTQARGYRSSVSAAGPDAMDSRSSIFPLASTGVMPAGAPAPSVKGERPNSNATQVTMRTMKTTKNDTKSEFPGLPSALRVEAEADRMRMVQLIVKQAEELKARQATLEGSQQQLEPNEDGLQPAPGADQGAGADTQRPPASPLNATAQRQSVVPPPVPDVYIAHYLLDYGNVIKGTTRTRKFKLTNTSMQVVTIQFDKVLLERYGLTVEPENILKLPGAPEHGSVEVSVTLKSSKVQAAGGMLDLTLPINVRSGPVVLLTIRAAIMTPDVKISADRLDFDAVQNGQCKVMVVQLQNTKAVAAEWAVKKPPEALKAKDWQFFQCSPSEGTLEPGETTNVKVMFTPMMNRESLYQQCLPIKVNYNSKVKEIACTGSGLTPKLVIKPTMVQCGAIVPRFEGQAANQGSFQLHNPCDFPITVVSLDFDKQYLADEEALRMIDRYNEQGVLYLRPLAPGEGLWPEITEEASHKAALEAAAATDQASGNGTASGIDAVAEDASEGDEVGTLELPIVPAEESLKTQPARTNVILFGAPKVGTSTQAALMASRYGIPSVTLNELIQEAADMQPPPALEVAASAGTGDAAAPDQAAASGRAAFDPTLADALYERLLWDEQDPDGSSARLQGRAASEVQELVGRALKQVLAQEKYQRGVVVDGLGNHYCSMKVAASQLLHALGLSPVFPEAPILDSKKAAAAAAAAKGGKSGKAAATAPDPDPVRWAGDTPLYVVELSAPRSTIAARLAAAAHHATDELPAAEATPAVTQSRPNTTAEGVASRPATSAASQGTPVPVAATAAAPATDVVQEAPIAALPAELEAAWSALEASRSELLALLGSQGPSNAANMRTVDASGDTNVVHLGAFGISFELGSIKSVLPQVPEDKTLVPNPWLMQIVNKPRSRSSRQPVLRFRIASLRDGPDPNAPPPSTSSSRPGSAPEGVVSRYGQPQTHLADESKWVIPAKGMVDLLILFQSDDVGRFTETLAFDVLGGERLNTMLVSGVCDYPRISTDYRNVFYKKTKVRPQTPLINRQYVVSRGAFEFGPLLAARPSNGYLEGAIPEHTAKLRITNNGHFDLHANVVLKSQVDPQFAAKLQAKLDEQRAALAAAEAARVAAATVVPPAGKAGKKEKEAAAAPAKKDPKKGVKEEPSTTPAFMLQPGALDLRIDETSELTIYAFPQEELEYEDVIVVTVKDNPVPVEFPVTVMGSRPRVDVHLDEDFTMAPAQVDSSAVPVAAQINKLLVEGIKFERLLLGKKDSKTFTISNPGLMPVRWQLVGVEELPREFTVSPSSGELAPRCDMHVTVQLEAFEKKTLANSMQLQVMDSRGLQGVVQEVPIALSAEAYKIEMDIKFPQQEMGGVDFGTMRVVDDVCRPMSIKNTGKYPITFRFMHKTATIRDLVTVTPAEGNIEPNKEAVIQVHFNRDLTLRRELTLLGNTDLQLFIIEPLTSNREELVPIKINAVCVFSKYAIVPARGINFGPVTYNTVSKPKTFEVSNDGQFPFEFRLFNYAVEKDGGTVQPRVASVIQPTKGGAKGAKAKEPTTANGGKLELGQFTVEPAYGTLEPGTKVDISVVFKAEGARSYSEVVGIDIKQRDPADQPGGAPYELSGESCIPGIDAEHVDAIFEEHTIVGHLDPFNPGRNEFGRTERVFNFGSIIAQLGKPDPDSPAGGVRASLKFINPVKVPCTVNFTIKPSGTVVPGEPFAIRVTPAQLIIPPHECRYTELQFEPRAIQAYTASFEAAVENGGDPATRSFVCELRGEGTLPSLTLLEPAVFDPQGRPLLKFPRLLKGRSTTAAIVLKNNGIMAATARLEMDPHPAFKLLDAPQVITVDSKKATSLTVQFTALDVKKFEGEVQLRVRQNPFENYRVALLGEGYLEDLTFEGLPNDSLDELRLPDGPTGSPRQVLFAIRNHSTKHFRFKWPEHANVRFTPALGHIHAGTVREVTMTLTADEPVKLTPYDAKLNVEEIQYAAGSPVDWDCTRTMLKIPDVAPTKPDPKKPSPTPPKTPPKTPPTSDPKNTAKQAPVPVVDVPAPVAEVVPEPEPKVATVPKTARDIVLKVHAVADNARYECDLKPVAFRPTMMFQTRTFNVPLTNTSSAKMDFRWSVVHPDGTPDTSGLFTVSPEGGVIEAGQTAQITVRFSPTEVDDCNRLLIADIPNLDASCVPLQKPISGKVLRPWCHFELPDSDYITAGRRNPELPGASGIVGSLDSATKVLEFESLGIKVRNTKRFFALNPTAVSYEFFWEPAGASGGAAAAFACTSRKGVISAGRRFEMAFEYTPVTDTIVESFWTFRIPSQDITVPFLFVGHVSEPHVQFDRPAINFGQVLIGGKAKQTVHLVNNEHMPFSFVLDKASYDAGDEAVASLGGKAVVTFEPSSGTVPANSKVALEATFVPRQERALNYNVACTVKKKPGRLTLNVKGEGAAIHETVQVETANGDPVVLAPSMPNAIEFGQVLINERAVKAVALINSGTVNFDFAWAVGTNPRVSVSPESGSVPQGERLVCELSYNPHAPDRLDDYRVGLQIMNGSSYTLHLKGNGHRPLLQPSFSSHDFGPQFVWQAGMEPATKVLRLKNADSVPISFDPQFEPREHLSVACGPTVLAPGEARDVVITFKPTAAQQYEDIIPIEVNGLFTMKVVIKGEGVPMLIEVAKGESSTVNFGPVQRSQSATRVVRIANRSKVAASLSLLPSLNMLQSYGIDTLPGRDMLLRPREATEITFFFRPKGRVRPFTEDLVVMVEGVELKLLTLTGACLGTELRLASDSVPFGPVVLGSRASKRLQLENTGDVGTKFSWDTAALGRHFTIFPAEGFLAPHQDVKLDVTFEPIALSSEAGRSAEDLRDIRVERVRLVVEGGEDRFITLTGAAVASEAQPEQVSFSCAVRGSCTKSITVKNPSSSSWQLRPVISNDFWTGAEFVSVPAGGKTDYTLTYRPLTMTSAEQPHTGSVFFPIPDGTGLLYKLTGRAESPVAEGTIEHTLKAKTQHVEVLKVHNWLHRPQRFRAVIDRKKADVATRLEGSEYIDVPAHSHKDYKLAFYAYTAGVTQAAVTFRNETTGEFSFYDVKYTTTAPPLQGTISMECPVRTQTSHKVVIANPLDAEVTVRCSVDSRQVSVPDKVVLAPRSSGHVEVRYRPLLVGEAAATLKLDSPELGLYEHALKLAGTTTNPERSMTFNVPLAGRETQVFRFTHWLDEKAEYSCSFKAGATSAFECQASITAAPAGPGGVPMELAVHFEPTSIGENLRDTLVVSSSTGGEYQCPLLGRCIPPKPQGPVDVSKGSGSVPFKNVFPKEAEFLFSVDNACFTVKPSEKLAAKKSTSIAVQYKADPARPRTGKLTVSCPGQTQSQWVFYLQA